MTPQVTTQISSETNSPPTHNWFRGFIRGKTRITIAWVYCVVLALLARHQPDTASLLLIALGAGFRFWASGHLRKDSKLTIRGPYLHTRNPLYFGTFLMGFGAAWSTQNPAFILATGLGFWALYHFIILDEETKLQEMFGASFVSYLKTVPRFWPRPWITKDARGTSGDAANSRFDFELAKKNKAFEAVWAALGLWAVLTLAQTFWALI